MAGWRGALEQLKAAWASLPESNRKEFLEKGKTLKNQLQELAELWPMLPDTVKADILAQAKVKADPQKANFRRVLCCMVCFAVGIGIPVIFRAAMFHLPPDGAWNLWRYIWCCCMALIGFGGLAYAYRYEPGTPYWQFLTWHVPLILAVSALVFAGLHLYPASSGPLFYYLSAGLCVPLGYSAERIPSLFQGVLERIGKK